MIFVTVGMHSEGFARLVKGADALAACLAEAVVIQAGATAYQPRHARCFGFAPLEDMERWCAAADVIVAQAGAGSILTAQRVGRPLVLVPRLRRYGESIDDHQRELARALQASGRAVMVEDTDQLASALVQARQPFAPTSPSRDLLIAALKRAVGELQLAGFRRASELR